MSEWLGRVRIAEKAGRRVYRDEWAYPKSVTFTFEGEADSPDLVAIFEMDPSSGPVCRSLTVSAKPGGRGVSDADVRLFELRSLGERAMAACALAPLHDGGHALDPKHSAEAEEVLRATSKDERLVDVARRYLRAYPTGAPLAAVEDVMTRRTAARWVAKAREAGLIPPTGAPDADYAAALGRLDTVGIPVSNERGNDGTVD